MPQARDRGCGRTSPAHTCSRTSTLQTERPSTSVVYGVPAVVSCYDILGELILNCKQDYPALPSNVNLMCRNSDEPTPPPPAGKFGPETLT